MLGPRLLTAARSAHKHLARLYNYALSSHLRNCNHYFITVNVRNVQTYSLIQRSGFQMAPQRKYERWFHYGQHKAKCRICRSSLSLSGRSGGTMPRHLKACSIEVYNEMIATLAAESTGDNQPTAAEQNNVHAALAQDHQPAVAHEDNSDEEFDSEAVIGKKCCTRARSFIRRAGMVMPRTT